MKKLILLCSAIVLTSVLYTSCKKKEVAPAGTETGVSVEEKNMSIVNKFTGTNCYYCGDWGWPMFEEVINEHHGIDAICIGSYSQNQFAKLLVNPFATAMDKRLPVTAGYPTFASNFFDAWTNTKTLQGMKDNINSKITEHNAAAVVANSALTYSVENDNIVVKTTTKFFQNVDGKYNISVLVLEDGVIANQSGPNGGPNASHHKVLKASNQDWGVTIVDGAKSAGSLIDQEISIAKDPSWNMDNVEIATVIWVKNGNKWDFLNAHLHKK